MASCRRTSVRASTRLYADAATAEGEGRNVIRQCPRPGRRPCGTQTPGKPVAPTGEPISPKSCLIPSEKKLFKFQRELSYR